MKNPLKFKVTDHTNYVENESIFFAFKGKNFNGINFIPNAIKNGAKEIYIDEKEKQNISLETVNLINENKIKINFFSELENLYPLICAKSYNFPAKKLFIIGITGTKGKTSSSVIFYEILSKLGFKVGLISSAFNKINDTEQPDSLLDTTPKADYIHHFLNECIKDSVTHVVIEVAAQAYTTKRILGIDFDIIIGTNLSMEHGEFYSSKENYYAAKYNFIAENLKENGTLILNNENEIINFEKIINFKKINILKHGNNNSDVDLNYKILNFDSKKIIFEFILKNNKNKKFIINLPLLGEHNVQNISGIILGLNSIFNNNFEIEKHLSLFENISQIPGRLEKINLKNNINVYIDRAHNPSSFEAVISCIRKTSKNLIILFGAGGDRDKKKRPIMGKIAENYADKIYLTSDNSRTESTEKIIMDILSEMKLNKKTTIILNRKEAIFDAIKNSENDSDILILGKGDEIFQEINNIKIPFSDLKVVLEYRDNINL